MAHDFRVAKRYAQSLFNVAESQGLVAAVDADLKSVCDSLHSSPAFRDFMARPETSHADKVALFDKVFGDRITSLTFSSVKMLVEKGRDSDLTAIQLVFAELRRKSEKVTKAVVYSAEPLDAAMTKSVLAKLESDLGSRVEATFQTDPDLIGGIKIEYDNFVVDGSVRGQLDRMKDKLVYDVQN